MPTSTIVNTYHNTCFGQQWLLLRKNDDDDDVGDDDVDDVQLGMEARAVVY